MQAIATKERLLIVGGGPTGVLSAVFASLAGYQVTLIEERESLLMEPSILARMLHTSAAEFIESDSIDTKRDVLEGALFSKLVLPDPVFGNMPIRAGLSEAALAAGFASLADFDGHMDTMRVLYEDYFDKYERKYPGRAASDLFGEPGGFISEVDLGQAQRLGWARNVAKLYQGSDKTLNTPQFAAWALAQLHKRGVSVKTSCSVESIEAKETESGRVFIAAISPSLNRRDPQGPLEFEQVLIATARLQKTGEGSHIGGDFQQHVTAIATFARPRPDFSTTIMFGGYHGGMLAYIDPLHAFLYAPGDDIVDPALSNFRVSHEFDTRHPPSMETTIPDDTRGENILTQLKVFYPDIEYVESIQLMRGRVLTHDVSLQNRRHFDPFVNQAGYISAASHKWTETARTALQAIKLLQNSSLERGYIHSDAIWFDTDIDITTIPDIVRSLKGDSDVFKSEAKIRSAQAQIGLPTALNYCAISEPGKG